MEGNEPKDPAAERRAKLQALRERRAQAGPAAGPGAAAGRAPGGAGGGGRPGGGAGGNEKDRRAALMKMLKENPEKRKELIEKYPKLKEAMQQRRAGAAGGGAPRPGGGAAAGVGVAGAARPAPAAAAAPAPGNGLDQQVKQLERRVADLDAQLRQTRAELNEARQPRAAVAPQPPPQRTAAKAKLAGLKKAPRKT